MAVSDSNSLKKTGAQNVCYRNLTLASCIDLDFVQSHDHVMVMNSSSHPDTTGCDDVITATSAPASGHYLPHPSSTDQYLYCTQAGGVAYIADCPPGFAYLHDVEDCFAPSSNDPALMCDVCTQDYLELGIFRFSVLTSRQHYVQCVSLGVCHLQDCLVGNVFSPSLQSCVAAASVSAEDPSGTDDVTSSGPQIVLIVAVASGGGVVLIVTTSVAVYVAKAPPPPAAGGEAAGKGCSVDWKKPFVVICYKRGSHPCAPGTSKEKPEAAVEAELDNNNSNSNNDANHGDDDESAVTDSSFLSSMTPPHGHLHGINTSSPPAFLATSSSSSFSGNGLPPQHHQPPDGQASPPPPPYPGGDHRPVSPPPSYRSSRGGLGRGGGGGALTPLEANFHTTRTPPPSYRTPRPDLLPVHRVKGLTVKSSPSKESGVVESQGDQQKVNMKLSSAGIPINNTPRATSAGWPVFKRPPALSNFAAAQHGHSMSKYSVQSAGHPMALPPSLMNTNTHNIKPDKPTTARVGWADRSAGGGQHVTQSLQREENRKTTDEKKKKELIKRGVLKSRKTGSFFKDP